MDEAIREVTIYHKGNGNGKRAGDHHAAWTEGGVGYGLRYYLEAEWGSERGRWILQ